MARSALDYPLVSVIVPTFNGERYIRETLASILNQDYENLEVLVVDDGSRDNTQKIVSSIADQRVRLCRHLRNRGIAAARNNGLRRAKGKYVCFFDHDDIMLPEAIRKRAEFLEKRDRANVVFGFTRDVIDTNGNPLSKNPLGESLQRQLEIIRFLRCFGAIQRNRFSELFCHFVALFTNLMMRASFMRKAGRFDESFAYLDDVDFIYKVNRMSDLYFVDAPLKHYRFHPRCHSFPFFAKTGTPKKQRIVRELKRVAGRYCLEHFFYFSAREKR